MNPFIIPTPRTFEQWFAAVVSTVIITVTVIIIASGNDVPELLGNAFMFVIGLWIKQPGANNEQRPV